MRADEDLASREERLRLAEQAVAAEREALRAERESLAQKRGLRDNLYGRINVSVKTMDRVILGLSAALLAAIVVGIIL